ncbi:MAG: hypothetical protein JW764_06990 [Chlorobiaceae bacterium]|nr:hypothetical protein [Chlorobiaceae bacterium]
MKKPLLSAALAIVFLLSYSIGFAALNQFTGNWKNTDPNTRGLTTLVISGSANALKMHAWGKCHPQDCDWGEVDAYAYAPNVSAPIDPSAQAVSAVYTTGFSQTLVIVTPAGKNAIRAQVYTRFTDNSNRSNYKATYAFRRQASLAPMKPLPGPIPMPLPAIKEDCLSFNPATTTVRNIDGRWTIADGNHLMFNFGDNKMEALQALKVIKYYRMNSSCFVGRPDPSFEYLLVNGKAPQGSMPGEDCVSFNPNTIEVKNIDGRWKIVDGSHWVFDFGNKEEEARTAFAIIKKYGFTRSCYVGRPDPSFQYLRK